MKSKARDVKKGDAIALAGEELKVEDVEISDVGKQGIRKVRIEARRKDGQKIVIIRPEDYPFDVKW